MRILPFMPPDEGYEPPMPERNQDEGFLDISHTCECAVVEESKLIAETLVLRCTLRPLPLQNPNVHVQLIAEGESLEASPLYEESFIAYGYNWESEDSCWQAIALDYKGIGRGTKEGEPFIFFETHLPVGELQLTYPLYTKPFIFEKGHYQERITTLSSGQILRSPPGVLDTQILRGYGGYYKPGVALEDIQQVYYKLTSTHRQTQVRLVTASTLHEQRTPPPLGGQVFDYAVQFMTLTKEEEYLSFVDALAAGYARVSVISELGSTIFSSFLCEPVAGFPHLVDVYFRHPRVREDL